MDGELEHLFWGPRKHFVQKIGILDAVYLFIIFATAYGLIKFSNLDNKSIVLAVAAICLLTSMIDWILVGLNFRNVYLDVRKYFLASGFVGIMSLVVPNEIELIQEGPSGFIAGYAFFRVAEISSNILNGLQFNLFFMGSIIKPSLRQKI